MFPYKRATIDYVFQFINDIKSINLNSVIKCFLMGVEFVGLGVWFITDFENSSPAVLNS